MSKGQSLDAIDGALGALEGVIAQLKRSTPPNQWHFVIEGYEHRLYQARQGVKALRNLKPEIITIPENYVHDCCTCSTSPMPPCSFCTRDTEEAAK